MRQALINENADLFQQNERYIMRITGNDTEGTDQLDNFRDPESKYPVIVTTSRLLSTGVDVQTCRLIVLDRDVGSMTEFKQIVGRGTRVHEDSKKLYFKLIDFRGATAHFADPEFDGEPVQIYEPGDDDPINPPDVPPTCDGDSEIPPEPGEDEVIVDGAPPDINIPVPGHHRHSLLRCVPGKNGLHRRVNPTLPALRPDAFRVEANCNSPKRHALRLHPLH
jgi:type I restriction enzyme R subunit